MNIGVDPRFLVKQATAPSSKEPGKEDPEALRQACREFEAVFLQELLKEMRNAIPKGGLLEKSQGEEIFEDLRDLEISRQMAHNQGVGIGEALFRQLNRIEKESK